MNKIPVGVLGATGTVGQRFVQLLADHPWFEVTVVTGSDRTVGRPYGEGVNWLMPGNVPPRTAELSVQPTGLELGLPGDPPVVFSALPTGEAKEWEPRFAAAGYAVVTNTSVFRMDPTVPLLIPEVNPDHTRLIPTQRQDHGWPGFIVASPNCSTTSAILPLKVFQEAFGVEAAIITTLQAISGAGYPGVSSLDIYDNVVPYIGGEEEKSEKEPLKILGKVENGKIVNFGGLKVSAHCNRVPVINGHTACISLEFGDKKPSLAEVEKIWREFRALPQELDLPFAPRQPIIVRSEANRPQPRRDRDEDKGMAVSVGRLRECPLFDIRFVGLSHNTVRGAAGGGILNAELLKAKGYLA